MTSKIDSSNRPFAHYPNTKSQGGPWTPVLADRVQFIQKKLLPGSKGYYRLALKERIAQLGELDYRYFHDQVQRLNLEVDRLKRENEALRLGYRSPLLDLFQDGPAPQPVIKEKEVGE